MTLADAPTLRHFAERAGKILFVAWCAPDGSRTAPDRAAYAELTKALFNGQVVTVRCTQADAVSLAGRQCLEAAP
jgi:hypothetical protein